MKGIRTIVPDPLSPTPMRTKDDVQQSSSTQINMDEWEMSRMQDQETWEKIMADRNTDVVAARPVPVACCGDCRAAGKAMSVVWPRLANAEVEGVPAMMPWSWYWS